VRFPCATRHVLVDTLGLVLHALVTAADVQDRDGGIRLLSTLFGQFPFLRKLFADSAYTGPIFQDGAANAMPGLLIEIVRRSDHAKGFVVEPMRWIVERTIGWLGRCRRLAKDWENRNSNALAFLRLASIRLMLRKLCNPFMKSSDGLTWGGYSSSIIYKAIAVSPP
jgi:putative transposase